MSQEDHLRKYLEESDLSDSDKAHFQDLMESALMRGQTLFRQGRINEAIAEYKKEHSRPIKTSNDAEIVQKSYVLKGRAYRELGDNENAIIAFEQARKLLKQYEVGSWPQVELAEIFIERRWFDKAIDLCQEVLATMPDWNARQTLAKALALKENQ